MNSILFNSQANWLKVLGQLAIYMEPKKSCPTVLLYISSREGILFAFTLTNTCCLISFKINNITNCTNMVAPTSSNLKKMGAFYLLARAAVPKLSILHTYSHSQ